MSIYGTVETYAKYECGNCGEVWSLDDLNPIKDLLRRVSPGEIMPAGECPSCGCLCHEQEKP